jgi:hypothetical protein
MADRTEEDQRSAEERAIEMFKIKKLIQSLEKARGCVAPSTPWRARGSLNESPHGGGQRNPPLLARS